MYMHNELDKKSTEQQTSAANDVASKRNFLVSAIEANKKYQDSLYILIRKIEENLHKIERKRKALNTLVNYCKQIKKRVKDSEYVKYILGAPYFKDESFFPAPKNPELDLINKNRMLRFINLNGSSWNRSDKLKLKEVVRKQLLIYNDSGAPSRNSSAVIDWDNISAFGVKSHTAEECRAMWELILRPDLSKTTWSATETKNLIIVAQRNNYRNWDKIAQQFGKRRSSLQCFMQFQGTMVNNDNTEKWTESEDTLLIELVDRLKIGKNYIPWPKISGFFECRTKEDIYTRYNVINPYIKKGCFTEAEDKALLAAVMIYKENFDAIPLEDILPGRSIKQARSRYINTLSHAHIPPTVWDLESDMKLLELVKEHGRKWSVVANILDKRTRASCRHRFSVLQQYINKNPKASLADAPRKLRLARRFFPVGVDVNKTNLSDCKSKGVIKDRKYEASIGEPLSTIDTDFSEFFSGMEYYGDSVGRREKSFFKHDEVKLMYKTVKSIFKIFNVTISKTKLEDQILNGNFSKYTEAEKLLLNYMLDNHDDDHGIFSKQSIKESKTNYSNKIIPTKCVVDNPHEVFSYVPFNDTKVKTYIRKRKKESVQPDQESLQSSVPPSIPSIKYSAENESYDNRHFLVPSFSTILGMRTLFLVMDGVQSNFQIISEVINPSQQYYAGIFCHVFKKMFHWPSILSYIKPDCEFTTIVENSKCIIEVSDGEENSETTNESMAPTSIQPNTKGRARNKKRKFSAITK